jgi:tRNA threonylcarbamoyladenosine biosynthesis protein TsaE
MTKFILKSESELRDLAFNFSKKTNSGILALYGELGAGKTTFVQGFAEGLGIKEKVISPTFVLIRQHTIPKTKKILFHIDLYRLENKIDFNSLGIKDLFSQDNLVVIEWAEKIEQHLPKGVIKIYIKKIDEGRELTILS